MTISFTKREATHKKEQIHFTMTESRNDLHLTSTGRGHEHRNRLVFPPVSFKRTLLHELPSSVANDRNLQHFYITTTGAAHDYKPANTSEKNMHKKAPGHWGVKYVEDTIKKLHVKPQRTPLTTGFQSSEMKNQFQGKVGNPKTTTHFSAHVQPPMFRHHHTSGPLKSLVASSVNPELSGQKYNIQDRGVFNYHGDMYLTTTQKDHRSFTKEERSRYPSKDYASYWECEKYSKAWGHGSKHNPLPADSVPREMGPMRDHTWFKTSTISQPRVPKQLDRVPHKGMCSDVIANFKTVSAAERDTLFHCPVATPWELQGPGTDEIFSVPKMYKTEYQSYASEKSVIV